MSDECWLLRRAAFVLSFEPPARTLNPRRLAHRFRRWPWQWPRALNPWLDLSHRRGCVREAEISERSLVRLDVVKPLEFVGTQRAGRVTQTLANSERDSKQKRDLFLLYEVVPKLSSGTQVV